MKSTDFRKKRLALALSQQALADELDIGLRTVIRWEMGHWPVPKMAELAMEWLVLKGTSKKQAA